MNQKKYKCPICGKRLKQIHGDSICKECGYHTSYEFSKISRPSEQTSSSSVTSTHPEQTTRYSYAQNHTAPYSHRASVSQNRRWIVLPVILGILCFLLCISLPELFEAFSDRAHSTNLAKRSSNKYSYFLSASSLPTSSQTPKPSKRKVTPGLPKSDLFQQLISHIFHKDYSKVTAKELRKVLALHISFPEEGYQTISYTLRNGESGTFYCDDVSIATSDIPCFTELRSLILEHGSLHAGDLDGLENLTELQCDNTPKELIHILNPKHITTLGINSDLFLSGLDGIEAFSNLTHLSLDSSHLKDISSLSHLPKLKELQILNGDSIESFQVLYALSSLESLTIDSKKLRDISFISQMLSLTALTIENSSILQIDALKDCKHNLTVLKLNDNYQITDYQAVSELTHLTDLSMTVSYSFESPILLPELANMPDLKRLSIGNFDDLSQIAHATGLEELTITGHHANDFSPLANLVKLVQLNLLDMSLEPSAFEPIMGLTQLETLNLEDSFIWGNVQQLLELPHLIEFNMNHCTAGFDMSTAPINTNLEILHMSHVFLKSLVNGTWDYNANQENNISLNEYTYVFQNYPHLKELYLADNQLIDLSFAASLKELKILDITDNYVTSLTPLAELDSLEAILCAVNPIAEEAGLNNKMRTEN